MPTISKTKNSSIAIGLALSPSGSLHLDKTNDDQQEVLLETAEKLESLFEKNFKMGLLDLGLTKFAEPLPTSFIFWQKFSQKFITYICHLPENNLNELLIITPPAQEELQELIMQAPFMKGNEYLNEDLLSDLWLELYDAFKKKLLLFSGNLKELLNSYSSSWNLVGRVCFHLAENKNNKEAPFAFLATYTTRLSSDHAPKHIPLSRALEEYAGEKNKPSLLALLVPIQKAAAKSTLIQKLFSSSEIFQPLAWTAHQAHNFLKDIGVFEDAGVIVRVPNWWNSQKPPRPQVALAIGETASRIMGLQSMLDFEIKATLSNGEELSPQEWQDLLASTEQFVKVKGQWVEVDQNKLKDVLTHWKKIQQNIKKNGLTFAQGVRLLSGADVLQDGESDAETSEQVRGWSNIQAGSWLKEQLLFLRNPEQASVNSKFSNNIHTFLTNHLHATLRPYQVNGVQWLWLLYNLKLGGCLADDMGLGKTIQIVALLLLIKYNQNNNKPHLLVVPASLLGNWQQELKRFAPSLTTLFLHPSFNNDNQEYNAHRFAKFDLVITTYSLAYRLKPLTDTNWDLVILDEAQTIKNPGTKQTRAVKGLKSNIRLVLTGTPIENRLIDLWSLFDFFAPGLLGSLKEFGHYSKKANKAEDSDKTALFNAAIRTLASPYILRRLKTDKRIISDLPDKTEIAAYCSLSKEQVILYQQAVEDLKTSLNDTNTIQRKGIIFSYLMRFKQICNHPCQWVGYGSYEPSESGKFLRIQEICEEIAAKQEKVLIFTQFQEIISPLAQYLSTIFKQEGLILHGGTPIEKRGKLVKAFAEEQGPPFFILSLKAGGTGLNLTTASHVIHFDRWWNPAIEQQATDRSYRIGQKRNVMVYKFICRGTIEEKTNELINAKKLLSTQLLETENEILLTELNDEQLINIVSLDIHKAFDED